MDHSLRFHFPFDLSDYLLFDISSPVMPAATPSAAAFTFSPRAAVLVRTLHGCPSGGRVTLACCSRCGLVGSTGCAYPATGLLCSLGIARTSESSAGGLGRSRACARPLLRPEDGAPRRYGQPGGLSAPQDESGRLRPVGGQVGRTEVPLFFLLHCMKTRPSGQACARCRCERRARALGQATAPKARRNGPMASGTCAA